MHVVLSDLSLPVGAGVRPSTLKSTFLSQDGILFFSPKRRIPRASLSIVKSDGNRRGRPRRSGITNVPANNENVSGKGKTDSEKSRSSSQEEIIALFKRIQTSISQKSDAKKKKNSTKTKQIRPTESVQQSAEQQQRESKGNSNAPPPDSKPFRPPSKFSKKSPIRTLTSVVGEIDDKSENSPPADVSRGSKTQENKILEEIKDTSENSPPTDISQESKIQEIDKLKLPQLKELAKSNGMKGYSKLKKGELVELLKGVTQIKS